jgi:ABC-type antimicrobial peptide transport system permease subunit
VTAEVFVMVLAGAVAGLGLGLGSVRFVDTLLYGVKATDLGMLALPSLAILFAALTAALVPVLRAVRIDPVTMLRVE